MELRMFGEKLVMTDDPENIKAIQETQFSEVAKSEEQRIIFHNIFGDNIFGSVYFLILFLQDQIKTDGCSEWGGVES
ncbi:Cytochrome P450, partial [Metarhizium majus ARSEF 297]